MYNKARQTVSAIAPPLRSQPLYQDKKPELNPRT